MTDATFTVTFGETLSLKPAPLTLTRYTPIGRSVMVYKPSSLVVAERSKLVPVWVAVTVAPTTEAPAGSVTFPVNCPEVLWAETAPANRRSAGRMAIIAIRREGRNARGLPPLRQLNIEPPVCRSASCY